MNKSSQAIGIEINPKLIGVLFTDRIENTLRFFCYFKNAEISQFDMPADANTDNLRHLLSALNMEATCTSVIVDEVVQGRVYLRTEDTHWLYTLLKSPRNALPPVDASIGSLPWQVIWKSPEAEVLQYGHPGKGEHCIAIRTEINGDDAARLMKSSKAFMDPVSAPRKQPYLKLYAGIAAVLLLVGVLIGGTIYYTFKSSDRASEPTVQAAQPATPVAAVASPSAKCFLLYNHRISGPFPVNVIADMNAAGLFNAETLCRLENSTEWVKPSEMSVIQSPK